MIVHPKLQLRPLADREESILLIMDPEGHYHSFLLDKAHLQDLAKLVDTQLNRPDFIDHCPDPAAHLQPVYFAPSETK